MRKPSRDGSCQGPGTEPMHDRRCGRPRGFPARLCPSLERSGQDAPVNGRYPIHEDQHDHGIYLPDTHKRTRLTAVSTPGPCPLPSLYGLFQTAAPSAADSHCIFPLVSTQLDQRITKPQTACLAPFLWAAPRFSRTFIRVWVRCPSCRRGLGAPRTVIRKGQTRIPLI